MIGIPLAMLISGLIGGGTSLLGGKLQANAARHSADLSDSFSREALDVEKQRDARDYAQYLRELERSWRNEDFDRSRKIGFEDAREARLTPFRQGGAAGYQQLSRLLLGDGSPFGGR